MNLDRIISYVTLKIKRTADKIKNEFPHLTENGQWRTTLNGSWTGGFWIGVLWLTYLATKNREFLELAHKWLPLLEQRKKERMFDLGFLFYPSFVLGYKITGEKSLKKVALEAAHTLADLSHKKSGFIYQEVSVDGEKFGGTCIDAMMDLLLLWWAHRETGKGEFHDAAYKHSINSMEKLLQHDRPVIQTMDFDLKTGEVVRKLTLHGYNYNSRWTRGQAWSIYGFTLAYNATKNKMFLDTAKRLADYFIKNLPNDLIPYWDLDDPDIPHAPRDSSAAAIACSGLMTLSKLSNTSRFERIAEKILNSLSTTCIAERDRDGILAHGCFDFPKRIGVDESLIWGDYYFLEALLKMRGLENYLLIP